MSSVSEMRHLVNKARRENNELTNELNEIKGGISYAYNSWNNLRNYVNNTMDNGTERIKHSHDSITAAYVMQGEIDKMYVLFKNIELANKRIRECTSLFISHTKDAKPIYGVKIQESNFRFGGWGVSS